MASSPAMPCMEWADITPVVALGGDSIVYQSLDADSDAIYVMYDYILSQTPLAVGEESGFVRFSVGDDVFDVFFTQGGPSGTLDAGDTVRVLKNGSEYDNSLGSIVGAVDFNSTSPNFPQPHNLFELKVVLLQTPETPGGSPPEEAGCTVPTRPFGAPFSREVRSFKSRLLLLTLSPAVRWPRWCPIGSTSSRGMTRTRLTPRAWARWLWRYWVARPLM